MSGISDRGPSTVSDIPREALSAIQQSSATGEETTDDRTEEAVDAREEDDIAERPLPLDQTFEILKNQRRRYVLKHLQSADGPVSLGDLAEEIAALENDKPVSQITSSERKRVYVGLYQCHLPKMDSMEVISFNKPRGIIEPGENMELLLPYLSLDSQADDSRSLRTAGVLLAASMGLLFLGTALGQSGAIPWLEISAVTVVSLFAVSTFSLRSVRGGEVD